MIDDCAFKQVGGNGRGREGSQEVCKIRSCDLRTKLSLGLNC
jgi:hypothetical protein